MRATLIPRSRCSHPAGPRDCTADDHQGNATQAHPRVRAGSDCASSALLVDRDARLPGVRGRAEQQPDRRAVQARSRRVLTAAVTTRSDPGGSERTQRQRRPPPVHRLRRDRDARGRAGGDGRRAGPPAGRRARVDRPASARLPSRDCARAACGRRGRACAAAWRALRPRRAGAAPGEPGSLEGPATRRSAAPTGTTPARARRARPRRGWRAGRGWRRAATFESLTCTQRRRSQADLGVELVEHVAESASAARIS